MTARFTELAWQETPIGTVSLRRRRDPTLNVDIYEIKLNDEFLMSSLFTVAEAELAHLGLDEVAGADLDVLVGGLGLGYTAAAALTHPLVRSVTVVEALDAVIDWHRRDLLPVSRSLNSDPRVRLLHDDFFAMTRREPAPAYPGSGYHAILVDIDHSPRQVLDRSHASFYTSQGLRRLARHLAAGGVFGLWSDDPPDADFITAVDEVFSRAAAHVVVFPNPLTGGESASTVYVAHL